MVEDDQDAATLEKILKAAAEIKDMARQRPGEARAMLDQAQHLIDLAEQIRADAERRQRIDLWRDRAHFTGEA